MKVDIESDDLKELYLLLENLQGFFHQELNYLNPDDIRKFADNNYPKIHKMYYETIWNYLPSDMQDKLIER